MEFLIHKENGRFRNLKKMEDYNKSLPDGTYKVVIERADKRTREQNAWFHAVLPEILHGLRDAGFDDIRTTEDAKDLVKSMFFKKTVSNGMEDITIVEGTSKQSKIDFSEKAEEIIKWAHEYLGLDIAPPETQLEIKI